MAEKEICGLSWVDAPPPDSRGSNGSAARWPLWLAEAKGRPGVWAHREYSSQRSASNAWRLTRARYDVAGFEATTRRLPDGRGGLYFRFVASGRRRSRAAS